MQKILRTLIRLFIFISFLAATLGFSFSNMRVSASPTLAPETTDSSIMFIENVGQFDKNARFQVRGGNNTIWLSEDCMWITVLEAQDITNSEDLISILDPLHVKNTSIKGANIKLSFDGANPHPTLEPFNRLETSVNYFIGNDPGQWHTDTPVWGGVRYKNLYPGIDLEFSSKNGQLVQQLILNNEASLDEVALQIDGAEYFKINNGNLTITTSTNQFSIPLIEVVGNGGASVVIPTIVNNQIISPFKSISTELGKEITNAGVSDLVFSSFLGGKDSDIGVDIAINAEGMAYVTGSTFSVDFPTNAGSFQQKSVDARAETFLVKFDQSGSNLIFATYLGGSGDDFSHGLAIDSDGNAYLTGQTNSNNFPFTSGAFDTGYNDNGDVFIAKLNSSGSDLLYSTYLGGNGSDLGQDIALDDDGSVYTTGRTYSSGFPVTAGSFDTSYNGGDFGDAFITKINLTNSTIGFSSFLGGSNGDAGFGIAIDPSKAIFVAGETRSSNFPTISGAFDTDYNGGESDAFIAKFTPSGSGLSYSTLLGGSLGDTANGIAIDKSGSAYITGFTASTDFPTTLGSYDTSYGGGTFDAFISKLNASGSTIDYSTYLGGNLADIGHSITVDKAGSTYVTGDTFSVDFPTTTNAFDTTNNDNSRDAFVSKMNSSGTALSYSTYFGGNGQDWGYGVALDSNGATYVTGATQSSDFPVTAGSFDTSLYSVYFEDAIIAKFMFNPPLPTIPSLSIPADDTRINNVTPSFLWNSVPNGDRYQIQISQFVDFINLIQDAELIPGDLSFVADPLSDGEYYWRVRALNSAGFEGPWSTSRSLTIDTIPPSSPTLVSPIDNLQISDNTPSFDWDNLDVASNIQISLTSDFSSIVQNVNLSSGITEYTSTPLINWQYYWRVRSLDIAGNYSEWSTIRTFTIDTTAPVIPVLISPTEGEVVRGTPSYSWLVTEDVNASVFEYDNNADFSSPVFTSEVLSATSITPPIQDVGNYYWHVKARDAAGNWSNWSDSRTITIKPLIPVAPSLVSPTMGKFTNDNTPTFTWKSVPDGNKYRIQISKTSTFTNPLISNILLSPGVLTYTAPQLANGKYYWRVKGFNILNESGAWSVVRNFTVDTVKPATPLLSSPANGASIAYIPTYKWQAVTGSKYYQFSYAKDAGFTQGVFTSTKLTVLSFKPTTQAKGTWYWRVRAQDAAGNWSSWSTPWKIFVN